LHVAVASTATTAHAALLKPQKCITGQSQLHRNIFSASDPPGGASSPARRILRRDQDGPADEKIATVNQ
jgi:hypothetical protein